MIKALVKKTQSGDRRAFRELVELHDRQIYALIRRYISEPDLAKDVYQDVFMSVYRNITQFKHQTEFSTWLYRITVNTCLSTLRKESRLPRAHIEPDRDDLHPSESPEKQMLVNDILELAATLPDKQRIVFFMRFQNDLKINEIADALDVDPGTVKGYLSRCVKRIREELAGGHHDSSRI